MKLVELLPQVYDELRKLAAANLPLLNGCASIRARYGNVHS